MPTGRKCHEVHGKNEHCVVRNCLVVLAGFISCLLFDSARSIWSSLPSGLVSWWPGDGNTIDIIGNNNGILENGAAFGAGRFDLAFKLDGVNDFVMVPHNPSLNFGTNDFTVSLWANFKSLSGEQIFIEKWDRWDGWILVKMSDNRIRLALGKDGLDELDLDAVPPSISVNTWFFITITREITFLPSIGTVVL